MATGTKLMKEISDQFLVCKVCMEPFKEPKTLSCLHTFCLNCVQQQYDAESNRPTRYTLYVRSVTCPLCRKKTELPTGGVRRLPDNFLVSNLTDVLAKRCVSKVPPCEICHTVQRSRTNDACSKCLDCDKLLCRACVELHAATKVTQDHGLIDIEGQKDIECKEHPEETVRFYCERCDACICVVCTFQEHKDHEICSFSDGFAKHKTKFEALLGKSKERLTTVAKRLQVIEKYEVLSKELKERIRDLAISYTSQVRAREKELVRKVDEMFSGSEGVSQLAENKQWLQESFDGLQSACNLAEIVMKDKGVEMLLLKKEIQGKLNSLLQGQLPPEPPDVEQQLDVKFVPGEVRLGEIRLPGEEEEEKEGMENGCDRTVLTNGVGSGKTKSSKPSSDAANVSSNGVSGPEEKTAQNGSMPEFNSSCSACKECQERKRKEDEDQKKRRRRRSPSIERDASGGPKLSKPATKSVYIQTKPQEVVKEEEEEEEEEDVADGGRGIRGSSGSKRRQGRFAAAGSQASLKSNAGVTVEDVQTATRVSSRSAATDSSSSSKDEAGTQKAEAVAVVEKKGMRTMKIQTEESCLRDNHLNSAASSSSGTYPFTGAAIAAAFLRHNRDLDDVMGKSGSQSMTSSSYSGGNCAVEEMKQMQDAGVATDVALAPSCSVNDVVAALSQGAAGGSMNGPPDLLAQTTAAESASASSSSSNPSWIRSLKIQTEISAVSEDASKSANDEEFKKMLMGGNSSTSSASKTPTATTSDRVTSPVTSPNLERARAARAAARAAAVSKKEVGVMTPFEVRIVQPSSDKQTSPEAVTSRDVELMTLPETRSLYIQTRGPRMANTGMSTDREGQMSKSTTTLSVLTVDSETSMPQVNQESVETWTEAVTTADRAMSTEAQKTNDAATLTVVVRTGEFGVQMRPQGVTACTNTTPPHRLSQLIQTLPPSTASKATMPDPAHITPQLSIDDVTSTTNTPTPPSASSSPSHSPKVSPKVPHRLSLTNLTVPEGLSLSSSRRSSMGSQSSVGDASKADKATETTVTAPKLTTRAVGPGEQMSLPRTVSTDTLQLTQVTDKETCTPQVKTVDEWTHTPQPQMINTGVTPPRPATIEVGVSTNPTTLMDQATYTEVKTLRETATETCTVVCDSETLTEKTLLCDAQTEAEPPKDEKGTGMEVATQQDDACMTDDELDEKGKDKKESMDSESQCQSPTLVSRESNTTRVRRKAKEIQTPFSYVECTKCQHPEQLEKDSEKDKSGSSKTFTDTWTDPSPPDTQDVGTMALACNGKDQSLGLVESGVQTSEASLYEKGVCTSFEWDEELLLPPRSFLGLECADAATSTESLPYIGLLSEIDVDELIVIPQANFELVSSDYDDWEGETVSMADGETWTGELDLVEQGTQTLVLPVLDSKGHEVISAPPALVQAVQEVCARNLVSVGVNTAPKVTFEKETTTPIRHLFSKGTMTFYVAKMDKATSTISTTRQPVGEPRGHPKDTKITMTTKKERHDIGVETDATPLDGRITKCISKLRNVSERLNSPTMRKHSDGEVFAFPGTNTTTGGRLSDPAVFVPPQSAPRPPGFPKLATGEAVMNLIRAGPEKSTEEEERQRQLHSLLAETDAVLRSKDPSPQRKAQPITTLKPRTPVVLPADSAPTGDGEASALPRQRSLERQKRVKMGSGGQATSPSRVPLQTLMNRIPGAPQSQAGLASPKDVSPNPAASSDSGAESDAHSTSSSQKAQQRHVLPAISETRASSTCSESSFVSHDPDNSSSAQALSSLAASMTSSHSRTPSNVTSVSDTTSDVADVSRDESDDTSSVSSASTTLTVPGDGSSPGKQKKEKKGFMQRLLSVKKKKDPADKDKDKDKESGGKPDSESAQKQTKVASPPSPKVAPKHQGAKPKTTAKPASAPKPAPAPTASAAATTPAQPQGPPVAPKPSASIPPILSAVAGATAAAVVAKPVSSLPDTKGAEASPPMPPHHYPPLPDPNQPPPPPRKPRPFVYIRQRIMPIDQDNVEEIIEKKEKEKEDEEKGKKEQEPEESEKENKEGQNVEHDSGKGSNGAIRKGGKDEGVTGPIKVEVHAQVKDQARVKGTTEVKVRATKASASRQKLANASKEKVTSKERLPHSASREKLSASVSREKLATMGGQKSDAATKGKDGKGGVDRGKDGKVSADSKGAAGGAKVAKKVEKPSKGDEKPSKPEKKESRLRPREWICGKS